MNESMAFPLLALGALAWVFPKAKQRLELSRAKHRSLAGHSRIAKRIAGLLPGYNYDETVFFNSDGASSAVVATVEDSALRTEMENLESDEEDTPRRVLWYNPLSWMGQIRPHHRDETWSDGL